jgi:hypothetical protein
MTWFWIFFFILSSDPSWTSHRRARLAAIHMIILAVFSELAKSSSALVEVALFSTSTLALFVPRLAVAAATATDFWSDILASSFQFPQEIGASTSCTSSLLSAAWISAPMTVLVAIPALLRSCPIRSDMVGVLSLLKSLNTLPSTLQ